MRDVAIVGAGMTTFGKFLDRSMKDIAGEAVKSALDSGGEAGDRPVRSPKVGLTENGGGMVKREAAALSVHIFSG